MSVYGSIDNIAVIVEQFQNSGHIKDYLYNFFYKFQLKTTDQDVELGFNKIEIVENIFAIEQVYKSAKFEVCKYESHKKHIDLHFIVRGEEIHYSNNINQMVLAQEYNMDNDFSLYKSCIKHHEKILMRGEVALYTASDVHMTGVQVSNSSLVVKTVIKIPKIGC
jgi:YhcH/YjgK/YiaL family protein